jgi:hypothetical protein
VRRGQYEPEKKMTMIQAAKSEVRNPKSGGLGALHGRFRYEAGIWAPDFRFRGVCRDFPIRVYPRPSAVQSPSLHHFGFRISDFGFRGGVRRAP